MGPNIKLLTPSLDNTNKFDDLITPTNFSPTSLMIWQHPNMFFTNKFLNVANMHKFIKNDVPLHGFTINSLNTALYGNEIKYGVMNCILNLLVDMTFKYIAPQKNQRTQAYFSYNCFNSRQFQIHFVHVQNLVLWYFCYNLSSIGEEYFK